MASVTAVDAAVAADPAIRNAVIADFKLLSRMSLGIFPNFGKAVDPAAKGVLGPVNLSRPKAEPSPEPKAKTSDKLGQPPQELETLGADRADPAEQRRVVADAESKLAAERAELARQRNQIVELADKIEAEWEKIQDERSQLALERELLEQARSDFNERQAAFEEDRRRFEANNEAAQSERDMQENLL